MKSYEVVYAPQSLQDIEEAVQYYNSITPGLGNKFIDDFLKVFRAISLNPFYASIKYKTIRCAAFHKFPFSVHYLVTSKPKQVFILGVFNTWKKPFW